VKAELTKLGDAPRAYREKLAMDETMIEEENAGRISIDSRFHSIEKVLPKGNQQNQQNP